MLGGSGPKVCPNPQARRIAGKSIYRLSLHRDPPSADTPGMATCRCVLVLIAISLAGAGCSHLHQDDQCHPKNQRVEKIRNRWNDALDSPPGKVVTGGLYLFGYLFGGRA